MRYLVLLFLLFAASATAQDLVVELTVPQAIAADIRDAFAWRFDYDRNKLLLSGDPDAEPPTAVYETKTAFAKRQIKQLIVITYVNYKTEQAAKEAAAEAGIEAEADAATITVQ